jgi:hypothetical protein
LAGVAGLGIVSAARLWPATLSDAPEHDHPDLPEDHPHLRAQGPAPHAHPVVIDDEHHTWPTHC